MKRNLKLIFSANNALLFLYSTQSNLNFQASFVGIRHVLREMLVFEHEFQARNFGQLSIFGGIKFVMKLSLKLLNFICISN